MNGKHTPGPWEANRTGAHSWIITTHGGHRYIAAIAAYLDSANERLKEHDANARLIASAPELLAERDVLLEAVKTAMSAIENDDSILEPPGYYRALAAAATWKEWAMEDEILKEIKAPDFADEVENE